jgi:hypothetical protein
MFKKNTLFILGAGASKTYGYPLGISLVNSIIKHIKDDIIWLPEDLPDIGVLQGSYNFSNYKDKIKKINLGDFISSNKEKCG